MSADAAVSPAPVSTSVPLIRLRSWPNNPRKTRPPEEEAKLLESVRASGGVPYQSLLVRPVGSGDSAGFEVVEGETRRRVLVTIHGVDADVAVPVVIREMSDDEAMEAALKANGDRNGLKPLEEAEALAALHRDGKGKSVAAIADEIGKPASFVASRLRLLQLVPFAQQLLSDDWLTLGGALALAALHGADEQLRTLVDLRFKPDAEGTQGEGENLRPAYVGYMRVAPTLVDVKDAISRNRRQLASAPFPIIDADLVPAAGACDTCPKRSAAQASLFGAGAADTCLDAACWASKLSTHSARVVAAAEVSGKLLDAKQTKKLFSEYGHRVEHNQPFVDVDEAAAYGQPTWRALLPPGNAVDIVVAVDPSGRARELLPKAIADAIRPAARVGPVEVDPDETPEEKAAREKRNAEAKERETKWEAEQKAEEKERKAQQAAEDRIFAAIGADFAKGLNETVLIVLAKAVLASEIENNNGWLEKDVASWFGIEAPDQDGDDDPATIQLACERIDALDDANGLALGVLRALLAPLYRKEFREAFFRTAINDLQLGDYDELVSAPKKPKKKPATAASKGAEALEEKEKEKEKETLLPLAEGKAGKVALAGVVREPGWLYFIDKAGHIARSRMVRGGEMKKPGEKEEIVVATGIARSKNYIYFMDDDGDVARVPRSSTKAAPTSKKKAKGGSK